MVAFVLLGMAAAGLLSAVAQQTSPTGAPGVEFFFSVIDHTNHTVNNLTASDISILDEGKAPQGPIALKLEADAPVRIVFLIDESGSTREATNYRDDIKGVMDLVKTGLRPQDQAAVVSFSDQVYIDQDMTSDMPKLEHAVRSLPIGVGGTALFDAITASTMHLVNETAAEGFRVRRAIVLVTDGDDNASKTKLEYAGGVAAENFVNVFAFQTKSPARRGDNNLRALAAKTGGLLFKAEKPQQILEQFALVKDLLHARYVLTYSPSGASGNPRFRKVEIETHDAQLEILAPAGYLVRR